MVESPIPRRMSVHQALGGGSVADILLWRNRGGSLLLITSATSLWLLFEGGGYNILSFTANVLLLLVVILFCWAKSASLFNRPLPPVPDLEISDASVEKAAEVLRVWISRLLSVAREIAVGGSFKVLAQVAISLWLISFVGNLCDFITFVYIGVFLSLSVPSLYEKYQVPVDQLLHRFLRMHFTRVDGSVLSRIPNPVTNEKIMKKTQ